MAIGDGVTIASVGAVGTVDAAIRGEPIGPIVVGVAVAGHGLGMLAP
jgi:hypothetical protein